MGESGMIVTLDVGGLVVALATLCLVACALVVGDRPATGRATGALCPVPRGDGATCGKQALHLDPFRGERVCEEHFGQLLGRVCLERLMDADMRYVSSRSGARSARIGGTD
jgi:hypothetical protein